MKIDVDIDKDKKDQVYVTIQDPRGSVSLTGNNIFLVFTLDQADRLAFQLSSALQDIDLTKEAENAKVWLSKTRMFKMSYLDDSRSL